MKFEWNEDRSYAEIRIDAVLHNFDALAAFLPSGVKTMAVVKANAYGHGAVPVAKALEPKTDLFAVACLSEARELREAGIAKPILILSGIAPSLYGALVDLDVTTTLWELEQAKALSRVAISVKKKAKVHLAVDTGMGRIGVMPDEKGAEIAERIALLPGIELEGVFSHYACADAVTTESALEQEARFDRFLALLEEKGIRPSLRHICNSAGTLRMKKKYDLCRFGISLYGYAPSDEMEPGAELLPAMTVKSRVICVKDVEKGTPIGYGHTYIAPSHRRIATLGIGYADGYNRCISGKGYVLLYGKRANIVGWICMDQMMVDVTDIPEVKVGDHAVILGKSGEEEITADLLGKWANSFSYEVLCTFLPRVERIY
ncbi:MAG: alanine racemase [Clostridia bacterium]|nr:alanine racemase [Clostridia bacterium]